MKSSSRLPRTASRLSDTLHNRLNMYALAASAAGVGMLAATPAAEGKVVYTPAHVKLQAGNPFPLDLNNDGKVDFYLFAYGFHSFTGGEALLACHNALSNGTRFVCASSSLGTNASNGIRMVKSGNNSFGAALHFGAKIRAGEQFRSKQAVELGSMAFPTSSTRPRWAGPWMNGGKGVKDRYLGIKFKVKDEFHFGWARLTVKTTTMGFAATLTGYAYETIPNKPIIAGKEHGANYAAAAPATLGMLALGRK